MSNEELFEDLKQFITATVTQQTFDLVQRMDSIETKMATKEDIHRLDAKIDDIQAAIADALTQGNEDTDATLKDHERRLRRLEHRTA